MDMEFAVTTEQWWNRIRSGCELAVLTGGIAVRDRVGMWGQDFAGAHVVGDDDLLLFVGDDGLLLFVGDDGLLLRHCLQS